MFERAHFTRPKKKESETTPNKSAISYPVAQKYNTLEWEGKKEGEKKKKKNSQDRFGRPFTFERNENMQ